MTFETNQGPIEISLVGGDFLLLRDRVEKALVQSGRLGQQTMPALIGFSGPLIEGGREVTSAILPVACGWHRTTSPNNSKTVERPRAPSPSMGG